MKTWCALPSLALACWLVGGTDGGVKTPPPILDDKFLVHAATEHHAEIEVSKLVERRSGSDAVKDFAKQHIKEHQAAYDKLAGLLKSRKIGVVAGTEESTKTALKRLGNLEGAAFDREYLNWVIKEHKTAITRFEMQADQGKADDIRAYAKELLPELRRHLAEAEKLAKKISQ
jgi:putative membrane protein